MNQIAGGDVSRVSRPLNQPTHYLPRRLAASVVSAQAFSVSAHAARSERQCTPTILYTYASAGPKAVVTQRSIISPSGAPPALVGLGLGL